MSFPVTLIDPLTRVSRSRHFSKPNITQSDAFYIVQLQTIYSLNIQYNEPLTYGPSAIAKPLVPLY